MQIVIWVIISYLDEGFMVIFKRYPHINGLIEHYKKILNRPDIAAIIKQGIQSKEDAEALSRFIWQMVEAVNKDGEEQIEVLGGTDNTEMLPDLNYEITKLMKDTGNYAVWLEVSNEEMG